MNNDTVPTPDAANALTRRRLLARATLATAALMTPLDFVQTVQAEQSTPPTTAATSMPVDGDPTSTAVRWLEGAIPADVVGTTFGVAWPRGVAGRDATFTIADGQANAVPSQAWPLARWADGSIKWSAHAIAFGGKPAGEYRVRLAEPGSVEALPASAVRVSETPESITVDTGSARWTIARSGEVLIQRGERGGRATLLNGRLVLLVQNAPSLEVSGTVERRAFAGRVDRITVEQAGPVREVVKIEGSHVSEARKLLPFVVRLYFYAGSSQVRAVHSFIYDADESKEFIAGLGVRFDVPLSDAAYDRHVRFVGEKNGVWAEAVQGITGLRRDPGDPVREAQVAGRATPPLSEWASSVRDRLAYIPRWGDYSLRQLADSAFDIRKRTKPGHGWIHAASDGRAAGVGYLGGSSGGVAFGLRDFWQRFPTQLDIRNAQSDVGEVTIWLWSPESPAMDLRFYHDGLGQDTHAKQLEGLEVTYEDYEPGFGSPLGIARTSELTLSLLSATPTREALAAFADSVRVPPLLVAAPAAYLRAGVFGGLWGGVDRSTPARARVEDELAFHLDHYIKEVEQRGWYGFWDHGDVMHTYDDDRHVWRYDIGGYAWDNSELSPDLWLWYSFLRTGRSDVFRFAEAMTRHTGEVDVYHAGPFKGLGSRHNVQHWGCSAKQLRISTPNYRRFLYYLTADERVGDLMRELVDSDETFMKLDPIRKIRVGTYEPQPAALSVGFGTDWGSVAIALFTEWERSGNERARAKLLAGMETIGSMPHGFFSSRATYDLATGRFTSIGDGVEVSHLSAVFGLPETVTELIQNFDVPAFKKAWLDYCEYYNASREDRRDAIGVDLRTAPLTDAHARLTALAALHRDKPALARRAWTEVLGTRPRPTMRATRIEPPLVLRAIDEARVSTNGTSQWSLAAIQCLALIGKSLPAE